MIFLFALVHGALASDVFDNLPKDHWAHEAAKQLVCDWCPAVHYDGRWTSGPETRHDFAVETVRANEALVNNDKAVVSITSKQLSNLMRLLDEFNSELATLGLDAVEMKGDILTLIRAKRMEMFTEVYPELAEMPEDHWAYQPMKRLYELGIFEGYTQQIEAQ